MRATKLMTAMELEVCMCVSYSTKKKKERKRIWWWRWISTTIPGNYLKDIRSFFFLINYFFRRRHCHTTEVLSSTTPRIIMKRYCVWWIHNHQYCVVLSVFVGRKRKRSPQHEVPFLLGEVLGFDDRRWCMYVCERFWQSDVVESFHAKHYTKWVTWLLPVGSLFCYFSIILITS